MLAVASSGRHRANTGQTTQQHKGQPSQLHTWTAAQLSHADTPFAVVQPRQRLWQEAFARLPAHSFKPPNATDTQASSIHMRHTSCC
jgi:hypothetical protein